MSKLTPFVDLNQQTIAVCARLGILRPLRFTAGVVELVDTTDSKSVALKSVPVQVRPPVPSIPLKTPQISHLQPSCSYILDNILDNG